MSEKPIQCRPKGGIDDVKERIEAATEADLDTWLQRVLFVSTRDDLFLDKRKFS